VGALIEGFGGSVSIDDGEFRTRRRGEGIAWRSRGLALGGTGPGEGGVVYCGDCSFLDPSLVWGICAN
jgi:hypothetical protein